MRTLFLALSCCFLLASPAAAVEYMTKEEALKLAFPSGAETKSEKNEVSAATLTKIEALWGKKPDDTKYKVYIGKSATGDVLGYALFLTRGTKYQPITFMVQINTSGEVGLVSIVVYREPRGEEVKDTRFLKQFFGKTKKDKLALNRDINSIAGATVSAEVVTAGVKEALLVVEDLYLSKLAATTPSAP